jgi:hypothetical protein
MPLLSKFFAATVLLPAALPVHAAAPPTRVVIVELCVAEQEPERIEAALTSPLEPLLRKLPGVASFKTVTGHGAAQFEIHFAGGASDDDLASVVRELERSDAYRASQVLSRSARLGDARPDELLFVGSLACMRKNR